jgi:hypothetical protein
MRRRLADRRGRPRFELVGELWGTMETVISMPLLNVSRGGALIESAMPLGSDSEHDVAISCDGAAVPARIRVRHTRAERDGEGRFRYFIGVEFVSMDASLGPQIDRWLQAGDAAVES